MINDFTTPENRWLSNFWVHPITIDGKVYGSTGHYYQAMKATTEQAHENVRTSKTPGAAKRMGKLITSRTDWDRVKEDVMLAALRAKFVPGTDLAERLLATGDKQLVEGNHWGDEYWGVCKGKGLNRLGHLLMLVRSELRG
tara:strand:- start:3790 stop:4212 length:423 start_codon:yes stop_codon:yes gene_type:complete